MPLLDRFLYANRRLSLAVEQLLPSAFKRHIQTSYRFGVAEVVNRRAGQTVLDIGGGKECPFLSLLDAPCAQLIVALDCSEAELRHNPQVDHKVVADAAAAGFPFRDGSVDVLVSRAVVEHIRDNAKFFENCAAVLSPGGRMIHAFSGKYAPFALLNQVLPNDLTRGLIGCLHPQWREEGNYGFLAFYDRCYCSAMEDLLHRNGFVNVRFTLFYYQSIYFTFFFPLYFLMLCYDLMISATGIRNLASGIIVTAERPLSQRAPVQT
jgi:SAM-dependent methyltransferase